MKERDFPGGAVVENVLSPAGNADLIPGQETPSHMPQPSVRILQLKIPHNRTEDLTCCNQDAKK